MCARRKLVNYTLKLTFNDVDGVDEDEEETVAIDRKRGRDSALALKRLEKNMHGTMSTKKPRVLVEVKSCTAQISFFL